MNITVCIARILSAYLIVTGMGFLLSPDYYSNMMQTKGSDPILINLSGMTHFLAGMTIVVLHFKWRKVLEILVSLLGLFFLAKGAFLIAMPELTLQTGGNEAQLSLLAPAAGFLLYGAITAYLAWTRERP